MTVQSNYIELLNHVKSYVQHDAPANVSISDNEDKVELTRGLLNAMDLPKLSLEPFDGDPSKYHAFIFSFQQNVAEHKEDRDAKLSRLLQ